MAPRTAWPLFARVGVEIEYMLVGRDSLDVRPMGDVALAALEADAAPGDRRRSPGIAWDNELVLHVLEGKLAEPAPTLIGVADRFQRAVRRANAVLAPLGARLMPGAAHPWMHPAREARLWPHDGAEIYNTFARLFGCRTHGWTNLQSVHLNLPFANDAEFARLHAAIRLLLPLLPALAAASPYLAGRHAGRLDARLEAYRVNARRVPSVTGAIIPEPLYSRRAYRAGILERIYRDLAPLDPEGILRDEWVNARGAIARFDRNTIEIRVIDAQECPRADLAIAWAAQQVLRALVAERWTGQAEQGAWPVAPLRRVLGATMRHADAAVIRNAAYLRQFGWTRGGACTAGALWDHLLTTAVPPRREFDAALRVIRDRGPLARRMLRTVGPRPTRRRLRAMAATLCECLEAGQLFP